ncbi:glycoside hydrolase family 3 N-terminal domain-containing protein [Microbacterium sp. ASV49]|uniref:beta-N-acetylhexosaminidase n=1 Tax=Microbacterium candidum TaxID=3041922 RepID=A0ABT7MUS9_9MICO|nr:glycoside hydrolase family 3 N-terminal domain-containing protein [Microbacterium sp. ASV49]MDL9978178.1 glycoside hydrolase family 3 N-terminal domain-containing protein [Microbacterium sp. ASV49]
MRAGGRTAAALALVVALGAAAVACAPERGPASSPTEAPSATPTAPPTPVDPIAALTLEQRVGQLFMVGTSVRGADPVTISAIVDRHAGSIFLHGRSQAGAAATAALVRSFTSLVGPATTAGVPLWVATDQEGGEVQVLQGPGFDRMPSALSQSALPDLEKQGETWGSQLSQVGVNMDLAPVADIVTSPGAARANPPIGALNREYGFDQASVAAHAGAFAEGMRSAGVVPTFKHFPGLGRVGGNTDFDAGIVDDTVTADAPDVDVYRQLTSHGVSAVMLSTAVYQRIDPSVPAVFSKAIVTDLLRGKVGFDGVVMTDDVSATAQMKAWSPADRAIQSIQAGVDVVLVSADPRVYAPMYDAVLAKAKADPVFAKQVDDAARRVVEAKARS